MRILYVGGTGEISFACVEESVRAGHQVTAFNRGKTADAERLGVEQVIGDFADDQAYAALAARDFDVVCQFLVYTPEQVERDIAAFAGHCGQYVFISSASAYQKPVPVARITEDTPLDNPFWAYSRGKAACEARLMQAHRSGQLPVTIVRPSHTYRQRFPSPVIHCDHLVWRLLRGKPVIVHGEGESVWTATHADDFARAFVRLCGNSDALGEAVHITDSMGHTWNRIIRTVGKTIGAAADIRPVLSKILVRHEPSWEGPLLGDKSNTLIFDTRKVERLAGGWRCEISLEQGLKRVWPTVKARLDSGYQPDPALDALIDRIVEEQGVH